jgi:catechol 2,3-dioxygenase-like lactoylglutathione lyase family enzyme
MPGQLSVKEVCLYCHNLEQAESFYGEVLGFKLYGKVTNRHVFFQAGGIMLLIFNPTSTALDKKLPPHFANGVQHIAFEANIGEYDLWKSRLHAHGVKILIEQEWASGRHSFYFYDPHGHLVEIAEPGIWRDLQET